MKRDSPLDDEEAKARAKYCSLEQDFLAVQKEFVSKKRKLQAAQRKKKTLLAEVKFLRERHRWLSRSQSPESEVQKIPNSSIKEPVEVLENKDHGVLESVLEKPMLIPDANNNLVVAEAGKSGEQKLIEMPRRPVEKPKSCLASGEKGKKRRISWEAQVVTRVVYFEAEL